MRLDIVFFIIFSLFQIDSFCQEKTLLKAWSGKNLEYIKIDSQYVYFEIDGIYDRQERYYLIGDTLRLYENYSSSRDNFSKQHIDNFDFLIKKLAKDKMVLKPLNKNAKNLTNQRRKLKYVDREAIKIRNYNFEQVKFKFEPYMYSYSALSIEANRSLKYIGRDSERRAVYQQGELSQEQYEQLISLLKSSEIDKLRNYPIFASHSDEYTLQFDYNNKSKVIKQFSLPSVTKELIDYLQKIPKKVDLKKTEPFEINFKEPYSH